MSLNDAILSIAIGILGVVVIYVYLVYMTKTVTPTNIPKKKPKR